MRALLVLGVVLLAGCTSPGPAPPSGPIVQDPGAPSLLSFRGRVTFPDSDFPAQVGTTCTEKEDGDPGCGLDEPTVVVGGDGRVFYTAACCIGVTSPVFVSEDEGATFRALEHPTKQGGGEGDLSVDAEGHLYYMDIDLATFGIARWGPDLQAAEYTRRPGIPLVDRPWVRATGDGVVLAIYNTGSDTIAYRSEDRGLTFSLLPVAQYGSGLAGAYVDSRRNTVGLYGAGSYMESTDGGATWGQRSEVEGCTDGEPSTYALEGAAMDEAGTVWHLRHGCVVGRALDGTFGEPSRAIPEDQQVAYSWIAAGHAGGIAVVWYGQDANATGDDAPWHVWVAVRTDVGGTWTRGRVDPDPVAVGSRERLGRRLGDFLQVAIGPDGAVHVAYAMNPEMDDSATAAYRRTGPVAALAPSQPLVGPFGGDVAPARTPSSSRSSEGQPAGA